MTNKELIELLEQYPKDLSVLQTFISKKKSVLASETSLVRIKILDNREYIELIHCEDQDTHENLQKHFEEIPIEGTVH